MGPDGKSSTFGRDPDDLTARTQFDTWLEAIRPVRMVASIFLVSSSITGTLLLTGRRRTQTTEQPPNKPVDATARSPVVKPESPAPTHHL